MSFQAESITCVPNVRCLGAGEVSEAALVRDILYVFQGIDGKFIKMSAQENCYKTDGKVKLLIVITSGKTEPFFKNIFSI